MSSECRPCRLVALERLASPRRFGSRVGVRALHLSNGSVAPPARHSCSGDGTREPSRRRILAASPKRAREGCIRGSLGTPRRRRTSAHLGLDGLRPRLRGVETEVDLAHRVARPAQKACREAVPSGSCSSLRVARASSKNMTGSSRFTPSAALRRSRPSARPRSSTGASERIPSTRRS